MFLSVSEMNRDYREGAILLPAAFGGREQGRLLLQFSFQVRFCQLLSHCPFTSSNARGPCRRPGNKALSPALLFAKVSIVMWSLTATIQGPYL